MALKIDLINIDNIKTIDQLQYLKDIGKLPGVMLPSLVERSTETTCDENLVFDKFGLYQGHN